MGKKIVVPCLDVIMIPFFLRNIHRCPLFARKARVNAEQVPPGHPIILLKSNKFNMAAVSVKRSIKTSKLRNYTARQNRKRVNYDQSLLDDRHHGFELSRSADRYSYFMYPSR